MMTPLRLVLDGVSCQRGGRIVFENLCAKLDAGGALLLTGPNGAGKTSLIRIIAGLLAPAAGQVMLVGTDGLPDGDIPVGERCHLIGARDGLKAAETVREALTFWHAVMGTSPESSVAAALHNYGLTPLAQLACGDLSSGQRRRVALARTLLSPASLRPLWLLDEPTNALDISAQDQLAACVAAHRAAGGMVLAATHQALDWPDCTMLRIG
jgi:heme exporter protein A